MYYSLWFLTNNINIINSVGFFLTSDFVFNFRYFIIFYKLTLKLFIEKICVYKWLSYSPLNENDRTNVLLVTCGEMMTEIISIINIVISLSILALRRTNYVTIEIKVMLHLNFSTGDKHANNFNLKLLHLFWIIISFITTTERWRDFNYDRVY